MNDNNDQSFVPGKFRQPTADAPAAYNVDLVRLAGLEQAVISLVQVLRNQSNEPQSLDGLISEVQSVEKAVKALKLEPKISVTAPKQSIAPQTIDLSPLLDVLRDVLSTLKANNEVEPDSNEQAALVTEPFDEYKVEYYDDTDDLPVATNYYLDGKQVARVEYKYNTSGNLVGAKKA